MTVVGYNTGRVQIRDANDTSRWDVTKIDGMLPNKRPDPMFLLESLGIETSSKPFGFKLVRNATNSTYFDQTKRSLLMMDKYLEIGFTLPTNKVMGLGQHNADYMLKEGNYTLFNRDQPGSPVWRGNGEQNLYGTHPFVMFRTQDN